MKIVVYKTLKNIPYYGDIPDFPELPDIRVEFYRFYIEREYWEEFEKDFIFPVNDLCGTTLDIGDVDYIGVEYCGKLKFWIENKLAGSVSPYLEPVCRKLLEFTERALEYKTGVGIEL